MALWVCVQHMWKKLFMQEYNPTLEKMISTKLTEDLAMHIMAKTFTFMVINQPFPKTQCHDNTVGHPAYSSLPPMTQLQIIKKYYLWSYQI